MNSMKKLTSSSHGYTLIELLIVATLIVTIGVALFVGFGARLSNLNYQFELNLFEDKVEQYRASAGSSSIFELDQSRFDDSCGYSGNVPSLVDINQCVWLGYYMDYVTNVSGEATAIDVMPMYGRVLDPGSDSLELNAYDPYVPVDNSGELAVVERIEFDDIRIQTSETFNDSILMFQGARVEITPVWFYAHDNNSAGITQQEFNRHVFNSPDNAPNYLQGFGFTNLNLTSAIDVGADFSGDITANKGSVFMVFAKSANNPGLSDGLDVGDVNTGLTLLHGIDVSGNYCINNSSGFGNLVNFGFGRYDSQISIEQDEDDTDVPGGIVKVCRT